MVDKEIITLKCKKCGEPLKLISSKNGTERYECDHCGNKTVGFCWDTGHEMCYNHSQNLLDYYGDRLLCTHLNDNLGIRDYNGNITWIDDLHLLPFDGIADWENIVYQLNKWNFNEILTFELNTNSKPDRHENDQYTQMPFELYLTEAYKRSCRVATMLERLKKHS